MISTDILPQKWRFLTAHVRYLSFCV